MLTDSPLIVLSIHLEVSCSTVLDAPAMTLGVASQRITRRVWLSLLGATSGIVGTIGLSVAAAAGVVRIETSLEGNKLSLVEVEVSAPSSPYAPTRTMSYDRLILTTVVDYASVIETNAGNTVTVLGSPDAEAPIGAARQRLLGDPYLNTGIFNMSYGTPGVHIAFDSPVRNGPGVDILLFELTIGSGQTPDPIEVLLPGGGGTVFRAASGAYQLQGAIPAAGLPGTFEAKVSANSAVDFATLRDAPLELVGVVTNPKWHALAIDLDAFGVPAWETVDELQILSDNRARNTPVDLLMVVGLPHANRPGDYDGNFLVDGHDFLEWQRSFSSSGFGLAADGNGDGRVDAEDLLVWLDHFGSDMAEAASIAAPEPTSIRLITAFFFNCLVIRRRG